MRTGFDGRASSLRSSHFARRATTCSTRLLFFDVPEHRNRRDDVAAHRRASRHGLLELAQRDGDAFAEDAALHILCNFELLLGITLADELHPELLDLLVEWPAELGAIAARLGVVVVDRIEQQHGGRCGLGGVAAALPPASPLGAARP